MTYDDKSGQLIFSTGKSVSCQDGIIGISPDLNLTEGWYSFLNGVDLTSIERIELCEYVMQRWLAWLIQTWRPDHD